ncbi:SDR family oxidoreductase [Flaviaesturariibacter amylovorans]|uniref:SDR family oxidoreductase n=1 Tax=Flaviaesturariibacter amylovorans TaxID=1084520 RepID=A0ABP8GFU9_9BACT
MKQVVIVTGASSGLGEQIATHLAAKGHIVYGTARSLGGQERPFRTLSMDVGSPESIAAAVAQVLAAEGRIDVLVNNAGLGIAGPVETLSIDDCARVLDTNVLGALRAVQAVLPAMRKQGSGKIINISSIGSEIGLPYRGMYSASKAALDRLTEALRTELAPFGVQACVVQPGGVRTDINANRLRSELPAGNPYKETFETTYALINESVDGGLDPKVFGTLLEQLLEAPVLRRVYRLGKPLEKFSVLLKRLLPSGAYDRMIRNHYRIPRKG